MKEKQGRIFYLDFIRVLAIFLVIFIHVSAIDTTLHIGSTQWQITRILNYLAHVSVPMFFMISGALLLSNPRTESISYTWKKRIPRVVIPFVAWSLLSTFFIALYAHSFDLGGALKMYAQFLYQPVSPTLWFMYPLIGLYVLSPVLRTFAKKASTKMLVYITSIWLITNSLMPTLSPFLPKSIMHALEFNPASSFYLVGGFAGYFILGYLITRLDVSKISYWALILIFLICLFAGDAYSTAYPKTNDMWNQYYVTSIFVLIMSLSFYLILQKLGQRTQSVGVKKTFAFFSPLVFGIYLVHNILILFLEHWFMANLPYQGLLATFTRYFAVAILASLIIWLLSLIPGINYILTGTRGGIGKNEYHYNNRDSSTDHISDDPLHSAE
ncbi:acyltransferase [Companilactobacillus mishanensis]|uniref:Acyltransferase n=1 Tax=Companilactobacillus mishanensis TaxID=2486008 RepID=A0A5P0ZGY8_9LACO|nr:acyltransferase [Companilactobacillus mishanensis]MQS52323.1 acyltransferase [Companilactobacillus mishanensis]